MKNIQQAKNHVNITQALFILNALTWLAFGITSLVKVRDSSEMSSTTALVIAILMVGNVVAMIVCAVGLGTRYKLLYWLALLVILINILLTFTDEFGVFDLITLVLDIIILGFLLLLIKEKTWVLKSS